MFLVIPIRSPFYFIHTGMEGPLHFRHCCQCEPALTGCKSVVLLTVCLWVFKILKLGCNTIRHIVCSFCSRFNRKSDMARETVQALPVLLTLNLSIYYTLFRVVYKSRQPAKFAGYSAKFRRLLSPVDQLLNI